MATGDQNDNVSRLRAMLPGGWFASPAPVLESLLAGFAAVLAQGYALIQYAKRQTRIATATDGFLDLISFDYLGALLPRRTGEMDSPYRARIQAALLREKATRNGIIKALLALTGRAPIIIEPAQPADVGAYGVSTSGYGVAGCYGSLLLPYQAFIRAFRPTGSGIPNVAGYGISTAGYGVASQGCYCDLSQITGQVTDSDIYSAISGAAPAATVLWTNISS